MTYSPSKKFSRTAVNPRQIVPPDHKVDVTRERRVRGIRILHVQEDCQPTDKFVRHTRLFQRHRQLLQGADQLEYALLEQNVYELPL